MTTGTIDGISYELIELGPIVLDRDNSSAREIYKVAWSDAINFGEVMLGGLFMSGSSVAWSPGATSVYCAGLKVVRVDIEKWGNGTFPSTTSSGNPYKDAKVTVTYGTLRSDPGIDLIEVNASVSGESVQLPNSSLKWSDGTPLGEGDVSQSAIMPCVEVSLNLKWCPTDGLATIGGMVGSINSGSLTITPSFSVAAECAMCLGGGVSFNINHQGIKSYNRSVKIVCRNVSWNKCLRINNQDWEYVSPTLYSTANLASLLSFS